MENNIDELNEQFKKSSENFTLNPSPVTWQNVEHAIRMKERKRRLIIIFFLLAGALAGSMFLFTFLSPTVNSPIDIKGSTDEKQKMNPINKNVSKEHNILPANNNSNKHAISETKTVTDNFNPENKLSASSGVFQTILITSKQPDTNENISLPDYSSQPDTNISASSTITPGIQLVHESDSILLLTKVNPDEKTQYDSLSPSMHDSSNTFTDSIKTHSHKGKWSIAIAIAIAPTLSLSKEKEDGDYQIISNYRDSSDNTLLSWNYHLTIICKVIPGLEIFTGIGIVNFRQEILNHQAVYKYDTINTGPLPAITISRGYYDINGNSTGSAINRFTYLEIPLGISYHFLHEHKFKLALQPEIALNKLLMSNGYAYNNLNSTYKKIKSSGLRSWLLSYGAGISFQYPILKKLHFEFTPYYKIYHKSLYPDSMPIQQYLQQVEFRFSFRWFVN